MSCVAMYICTWISGSSPSLVDITMMSKSFILIYQSKVVGENNNSRVRASP